MRNPALSIALFSVCLAAVPAAFSAGEADAVLAGHPYPSAKALQEALDPVIEAGASEMDCLLAAVTDRITDDTPARIAAEAMTHRVCRPDAPAGQRGAWAQALVRSLSSPEVSVRRMSLHQLKRAGSATDVAGIRSLLMDPDLAGATVQTLIAIGRAGAAEPVARVLLKAISTMPEAHQPAAITALGLLHDRKAVPDLIKLGRTETEAVREAALWALARIGDSKAEKLLLDNMTSPVYGVGLPAERFLVYLRRIQVLGNERDARKLLTRLMKAYPAETHPAISSALLYEAEMLIPTKTPELLFTAFASSNTGLRETATTLLAARSDSSITGEVVRRMNESATENRVAFMQLLARRGGTEAFAALSAQASEPGPTQADALEAMSRVDLESSLPTLINMLGSDQEELAGRAQAILTTARSKTMASAIEKAWKSDLHPRQRLALLKIMGERRERSLVQIPLDAALSDDGTLRQASFKTLQNLAGPAQLPALLELLRSPKDPSDRKGLQPVVVEACREILGEEERVAPVLQALAQSSGDERIALLDVLRGLSGSQALEAVKRDLGQTDSDVAEAALRTLAGWPDWDAAPTLLEVARDAESETLHVLALRGWLRLAQNQWKGALDKMGPARLNAARVAYTAALDAAHRDEERNTIADKLNLLREALDSADRDQDVGLN